MEADRTRILEMLKEGKITVEQAGELLSALQESRGPEPRAGAQQEGSQARPHWPGGVDWAQFGRAVAERAQREVASRLAGKFGGGDAVAEQGVIAGMRRAIFPRQGRGRGEEAVLTSYAIDEGRIDLNITGCGARVNLELAGAEDGEFRLLVLKPAREGALAEGWEQSVPWSSDREGGKHSFTLGDPGSRDATKDLTFRFEIPCQVDLRARLESGPIAASGLAGSVSLLTGEGHITVSRIEGEVKIETGGGHVSATAVEGDVLADTGGGNVTLSNIEGSVDANTGGGNVAVGDVEGSVDVDTGKGNVAVSKVEGSVDVDAGSGNVAIGKVEGSVDVDTDKGNIAMNAIEGSVDARAASGGNIAVNSIEGDVRLDSQGGAIAVSGVEGSVVATSGGGNIAVYKVEGELTIEPAGGRTAINNVSGPVHMGG